MDVVHLRDPAAFLDLVATELRGDEGHNQLALGILANAAAGRRGYGSVDAWAVLDPDPLAVAVRTPPRNVILADPRSDAALDMLADAVAADAPDAPGVVGNVPAVDGFTARWASRTNAATRTSMRQGVFALERVEEVEHPEGHAEPAAPGDREALVRWLLDFTAEALPSEPPDEDGARREVDERLISGDAGLWVWRVDRAPSSLSGYSGPTGTGIRIGPVYTPPEHRRRGYATALVADLSAEHLRRGFRTCYLYTDLANPTSNAIYETIGYRRIAESKVITFERPEPAVPSTS
jgi:predicted GNAT family acetyltransferase